MDVRKAESSTNAKCVLDMVNKNFDVENNANCNSILIAEN